jgi:hypothetical protein
VKLAQRERRLLIGLAVVLVLALLVRWSGADSGAVVGSAPGAGGETESEELTVREIVPLDVAALRPQEGSFGVGRDPFRYGPVPTPPPPPPTPPPPPPPPQVVEVVPVTPPPPPVPQPPDSSHLRYLGSFGPADARIAVVLAGDELYNVREGAVLEGRFIVHEIGYESLAIAFVGFPDAEPRRLPAGGAG